METMTNEEKANEIARDMLPYNNAEYHACYNSAIKAMEWKEKQMVSRAKTFIKEIARVCDITDENGYSIDNRYFLAELEKAMKGE